MEITFEKIQKANETIRTTDIKGKEYAEVNQRIKAFRMIHPVGKIETELVSNENGICVVKAIVATYEGNILGTGIAYEKEGSSFINKTSYIENCETSAVGRALGMAGFGIDTSIASFEEVANAVQQQEGDKQISKTQQEAMIKSIENRNMSNENILKILEKYGYKKIEEIKIKDYMNIVTEFQKLVKEGV